MHPLHLELFFFVIYDHLSHWHRCYRAFHIFYQYLLFFSSEMEACRDQPLSSQWRERLALIWVTTKPAAEQWETALTAQQVESSRWLRALQVQRTRTAAAFTSCDYPLNPLCARRVIEPCLTSVSRSPRQGERTFDIFCLATTFCHQKNIFWPHIRKCTMGLDGLQVASISAWSHSAEVLELCLVWLKAAPHLRPWMETVHKAASAQLQLSPGHTPPRAKRAPVCKLG